MAVTAAQAKGGQSQAKGNQKQTKLDDNVKEPGVTQPGDAPFDTTDPEEIATSVSPDKAAAAKAGHGVVNAVLPLEAIPGTVKPDEVAKFNGDGRRGTDDGGDRVETYSVVGPDGKLVKMEHNIETGETKKV